MPGMSWEFECYAGTRFEIQLHGNAMNVLLMDADNFAAWDNGEAYEAFGGYCDVTPTVLQAPTDGWWYVVVDNGDAEELGEVDATVTMLD
jgi:hypothetical protein